MRRDERISLSSPRGNKQAGEAKCTVPLTRPLCRPPRLPPLLHSLSPSAIGESSRSPVKRAPGWCKMLAVTLEVLGAFNHLKLPKHPTFPDFSGGLCSISIFFPLYSWKKYRWKINYIFSPLPGVPPPEITLNAASRVILFQRYVPRLIAALNFHSGEHVWSLQLTDVLAV